MKYLGHVMTLCLVSLPAFANYPDEINYPYYETIFKSHSDDLSRLTIRFQSLDRDTRNLYSEIERLQITFNDYSNEIVSISNSLRRLSDESRQLGGQRDRLVRDERTLSQQVSRVKGDYDRLKRDVDNETRRLGPLLNQVNRVENEVKSARSKHSAESQRLQSVQREINLAKTTLSRVNNDIARLEAVSQRTPAQQSNLDNLRTHRASLNTEISRKTVQVNHHQSNLNQYAQILSTKENELRNVRGQYDREARRLNDLKASLSRVQIQYNDLDKQLRSVRTSLTNTDRRVSSIRTEVTRLEIRKRDIDRAQDSLRYQIDTSRRRYADQSRELENLERDIQGKRSLVSNAQYEFQKRAELYNKFLVDAQDIGRSQVVSAEERGRLQGSKDAQKKGYALGDNIGQSLGMSSGNLWGAVRAEVLAYQEGYEIGYNMSPADAQSAADKDAAKASKAYVESVLRPAYFEEVVQSEIKKPFYIQKKLEVPQILSFMFTELSSDLEVSAQELAASDRLVTVYDSTISKYKEEKGQAEKNLEHAQDAVNSYEEQANYPYDAINCSNVYKGVRDFKEACEEQFYSYYAATFENSAYESYVADFNSYFNESLEASFNRSVQKQYDISYGKAFDVTKQFAIEEGRKAMYSEAYELQYQISYNKHLEIEKKRVRSEVNNEFNLFLEKNPLLTMVSLNAPNEIIAGEQVMISSLIRNLGMKNGGIAHLNILRVNGAEVVSKKVTTPVIGARIQTEVSGPVVRVLPEMVTGSTISVEVEATLPGDNYRSARTERLVLERKVSISPFQDLNLNVDYSPSVRNVLRRFLVHTLSVDVTPKYEDLKTDLDVNLVALSGGEHIEFKVTNQKVNKMKKGSKKNIKFSYVFKDSAKGENIELALEFLYKGKVVQTQKIDLRPH